MTYQLKNLETGRVIETDTDPDRLYAEAQDRGMMRPADWDEGGPAYLVMLAPYDVVQAAG